MSTFSFCYFGYLSFVFFIPLPHVVYFTAHWHQHRSSHTQKNVRMQTCTFFPFLLWFVLWREGQGNIPISLGGFGSLNVSVTFKSITTYLLWWWLIQSLYKPFRIFFLALSYLFFLKSFSYTDRFTALGVERIPNNLEVVCLVLLIRSILCRRETKKSLHSLKQT